MTTLQKVVEFSATPRATDTLGFREQLENGVTVEIHLKLKPRNMRAIAMSNVQGMGQRNVVAFLR